MAHSSRKILGKGSSSMHFFYGLDYNLRCSDGHRWYMPRRKRGMYCNYPLGENRKGCRKPLHEIRSSKKSVTR